MREALRELREILQSHAQRYPLAQPQDFVKLVYQNEFGPGHLIFDGKKTVEYLLEEMERVTPDPTLPLLEDIGNGLVRVNLAALPEDYPLHSLCTDFIMTASLHRGSMERFREKINLLHIFVAENELAFSHIDFGDFAIPYVNAGCPMVSHSQVYKEAYSPAYRVVRKDQISWKAKEEN